MADLALGWIHFPRYRAAGARRRAIPVGLMLRKRRFLMIDNTHEVSRNASATKSARFLALIFGDSGEAERLFRRGAERHSGMNPNTIGA